jgi:transcriptional regulator with AAA-type ATPase domain
VHVLNVLYITSCRKDVRDLHYSSRGVWKIRWIPDPETFLMQVATGGYDLLLVDLTVTGFYLPDFLSRLASFSHHLHVFLLSRDYAHQFQRLSDRFGFAGYLHLARSGFRVFSEINGFFSVLPVSGIEGKSYRFDDSSPLFVSEPSVFSERDSDVTRSLIGQSRKMRELRHTIVSMSDFTRPVLITGETGTGKELVARLIQRLSPVSDGPFIPYNVSCIPEGLAESVLFGTKRGCYTGVVDNPGLFEQADKGTLFLDEIEELSLSVQPKFLRVLEESTVRRLGATSDCPVNFRLLCATNKKLSDEVASGHFREDLLFRIDVLRIEIPPLRERPEDIPGLSATALAPFKKTLSLSALDMIQHHFWKGNVRELIHCMERSACACEGPVIQKEQILF